MNFSAIAILANMVSGIINIGIGLIVLSMDKPYSMIFSMLCAISNFLIDLIMYKNSSR